MAQQSNRPIGIFDSGVGGLTVLREVQARLPHESVIYVGDTANAPYGGKTPEELLECGRDIIRFMRGQGVKAVVLACGTTSSTVYDDLVAENPDLPLVDVVRPGVLACAEIGLKRIGLVATAATIKSGLFARLVAQEAPHVSLVAQACPLFAPIVEAGATKTVVARFVAETYLGKWRGQVDALVLGCTHYPLLTDALSDVLDGDMQYINLAAYTAKALYAKLEAEGITSDGKAPAEYSYYVSGEPNAFDKTAHFLLESSPQAKQMNI